MGGEAEAGGFCLKQMRQHVGLTEVHVSVVYQSHVGQVGRRVAMCAGVGVLCGAWSRGHSGCVAPDMFGVICFCARRVRIRGNALKVCTAVVREISW